MCTAKMHRKKPHKQKQLNAKRQSSVICANKASQMTTSQPRTTISHRATNTKSTPRAAPTARANRCRLAIKLTKPSPSVTLPKQANSSLALVHVALKTSRNFRTASTTPQHSAKKLLHRQLQTRRKKHVHVRKHSADDLASFNISQKWRTIHPIIQCMQKQR